jgi:hypothetical protein
VLQNFANHKTPKFFPVTIREIKINNETLSYVVYFDDGGWDEIYENIEIRNNNYILFSKILISSSPPCALKDEKRGNFMKAEILAFINLLRWKIVKTSIGEKLNSTTWRFKLKNDGRFKFRVCVRDFTQIKGKDFIEFTPLWY